ncbi:cytosine permease [Methanobrevibacter millerae]|uniref:Hydroxymethylpyrimidine transporter CytX n=1 Tax=Methanobrevibacter millerae TaxID=230361 RepID=A0A0U3CWZ7_9EURY|nr:cytosine permease [Methanobrevibacter millerae]ALT68884.1 hydroxymethylpyrimidine transporter CytX [Methanobrevibacter millerae]MBP3225831.1 cytosine permease [Methanobrevibacter sp.]
MDNRTGLFTNAVIWFGVAISVSEIQAGIQIASASSIGSVWVPLILGHIIGGILLFSVGLIGARLRVNAMESIKSTFGNYGSKFFAILNVLQLIAWVAVLNAQGAMALMGLNLEIAFPIICMILAVLVALWVYIGLKRSSKVTTIIMMLLTILLILLSVKLFAVKSYQPLPVANASALTFWNIFEISIAMPVSWLPVISDYTKDVKKPVKATAISAIAYTIASLWMYFIGIEIVGIGTLDISQAILIAGLGIQGVLILVLSTVTTNFLATNSAGESAKAIFNRLDPKIAGVIVSFLSALLAISGIMNHYISFLYLITSVFAPMAAVLIVSFYCGNEHNERKDFCWNIFAWFVGFIIYQVSAGLDSVFLGPTLLAVIASSLLSYLWIKFKKSVFTNS